MRLALIIATICLAGCSAKLEGVTERGGLVGFPYSNTSSAVAVADAHCRQYGRVAEIVGPGTLAAQLVFRCVDAAR